MSLQHGDLLNIFKIYSTSGTDIDLTREQALRLFHQLQLKLFPRARPTRKAKRAKR